MYFSQLSKPLLLLALACGPSCTVLAHPLNIIPPSPPTIEIDLLFPQNATYAPPSSFPLLFSLQNVAATPPSSDLLLTWTLHRRGEPAPVLESSTPLAPIDTLPASNTLWLAPRTPLLNSPAAAGTYVLSWSVSFSTCSETEQKRDAIENSLVFTIHPAGQIPDPASAEACTAQNATLAITAAKEPGIDDGGETWEVMLTPAPRLANPCGARVKGGGEDGVDTEPVSLTGSPSPSPSQRWMERMLR
ncbi:hypothetical protein C8A05DRAFT_31335 [Staphylotrichum tortipilum]|uniref:DUF7136 domain-containing protein n=1 Tax=Staphylotrichum tortipilum TaxID=2831512 RepID=A0AAN6RW13_9PEZI|nr:hypothetical protein C8A05DRAFT_31335 [Staphylotrichum longicolle]